MILIDVYCCTCGTVSRDVYADAVDGIVLRCSQCDSDTAHVPVCNGGIGRRYRCQDFPTWREDPNFYRGQTSHTVECVECDENGNETPTMHLNGTPVHSQPRFLEDASAERRDRLEHKLRSDAGMTPLFVETKGI